MAARFFTAFLLICCFPLLSRAAGVDGKAVAAHARVPDGLEVTVWAQAPQFFNPTNLDIDRFGRVWVAEAVNYRMFNNQSKQPLKHPDGDRVMVLEDADGDGVAEKSHLFVEDKDVVARRARRTWASSSPTATTRRASASASRPARSTGG